MFIVLAEYGLVHRGDCINCLVHRGNCINCLVHRGDCINCLVHRGDCINCETCYFCFDPAFVWPRLGRADFHSV